MSVRSPDVKEAVAARRIDEGDDGFGTARRRLTLVCGSSGTSGSHVAG